LEAAYEKKINEENKSKEKEENYLFTIIISVILILLIALVFYFFYNKRFKKEKRIEEDKKAVELMDLIQKRGGRITQKELREIMPIGEAQLSLLLSELEFEGYVKKLKQGRGNIIILKKEIKKKK
jgi:uncharacterized membrane protein